ncbi:hypothetical protein KY285_010765 [Solanum tuberosum]|nr:hypothetical protein KY289_011339 [Solanum tuberosum]KAH0709188.1 hypothetical protein KY284_010615 [Solanum tuberosum]KAH0735058.1 hypothetical protein KY285_010765 [Solanum tuberosum]
MEWWDGLYDMYNIYQAEKAQGSFVEAAEATHNEVYHLPSDISTSSPVVLAFHPTTPEGELMFDLRFVFKWIVQVRGCNMLWFFDDVDQHFCT